MYIQIPRAFFFFLFPSLLSAVLFLFPATSPSFFPAPSSCCCSPASVSPQPSSADPKGASSLRPKKSRLSSETLPPFPFITWRGRSRENDETPRPDPSASPTAPTGPRVGPGSRRAYGTEPADPRRGGNKVQSRPSLPTPRWHRTPKRLASTPKRRTSKRAPAPKRRNSSCASMLPCTGSSEHFRETRRRSLAG